MKRKTKVLLISYGTALLLVFNAALWACHVGADGYRARLDVHANRAFSEAFSAAERLDHSLKKLTFASDTAMENAVCMEIYSDAQSLETALTILPVELDALEQISKHVSLAGDYAYMLSREAAAGHQISETSRAVLTDFSDVTTTLHTALDTLRQSLFDGDVVPEHYALLTDSLDDLKYETKSAADTLDAEMHSLAESFQDVPALSYDGKYTDHSADRPQMLEGKPDIGEQQARENAAAFLGCSADELVPLGRTEGAISCWRFHTNRNGETTIAVTVQGGEVLRVLSADQSNVSDEQDAALQFLSEHGFENMKPLDQEGQTYVPVQSDVYLLPDSVSLLLSNDGSVICFDASHYLMNHGERDLSGFEVDTDFSSAVPANVSVTDQRKVLLQSPGGLERACLELICSAKDGSICVVDYNLESGHQERLRMSGESSF